MTQYGVTADGFVLKRFSDIKAEKEADYVAAFGSIDVSPQSVFGQIIGVESEREASIWELAEDVYYSMYPASAEGFSLDNTSDLSNITRLSATSSIVNVAMEGNEGTAIDTTTQFRQENTNEIFQASIATTITKADVQKVVISIDSGVSFPLAGGELFTVTIDSTPYTYTGIAADTIIEVLNGLVSAITVQTPSADLVAETLTVLASDLTVNFSVDVNANLDIDEIWSPVMSAALNTGSLTVPINSINQIETPVSGLNQVDNLAAGTAGRDLETDTALRLRRKQSLRVTGAASIPAIEARISQEVDDVTDVYVAENRTDDTVGGMPPHSIEAVVSGGTDQDIADKLWETRAGGIRTYGNSFADVVDSQGNTQRMYFSRPVPKYIHMDIEISLYDEETFPADGIAAIKTALVEFGETLTAGSDVIRQRFISPIFSIEGVGGIGKLELGTTENPGDDVVSFESGTNTSIVAFQLNDSAASFITNGVVSGMVVQNITDGLFATVVSVDSETKLTLSHDIFNAGENYQIQVYGAVNIAINSNELALFDEDRIDIAIV